MRSLNLPCVIAVAPARHLQKLHRLPRLRRPRRKQHLAIPRLTSKVRARKVGRAVGARCLRRRCLSVCAAKCRAGQKSRRHPPSFDTGGGCHASGRKTQWRQNRCGPRRVRWRHRLVADPVARTPETAQRPDSKAAQQSPSGAMAGHRRCIGLDPATSGLEPGQRPIESAVRRCLPSPRPPGIAHRQRQYPALATSRPQSIRRITALA